MKIDGCTFKDVGVPLSVDGIDVNAEFIKAQAEIVNLQAEVERLTAELNMERIMVCILHDKTDTVHNDAIESAAHLIECDGDALRGKEDAARYIRSLKRPT